MADWNEKWFIEDLKKLFALKDFYRQLEKLELRLAPEFRARLEMNWNPATKSKLIAELFKELLLVGLDKRVRKNELAEFISRCTTVRSNANEPR